MKMLLSLIPDGQHVARAEQALLAAGLGEGAINAVVRPAEVWERLGGPKKLRILFRYTALGALLGLGVGAFYGVPSGILNCSQMDCPFSTSTVLLALISVYWVVGGAFLGAIAGADHLEENLYSYVEGVRRGAALLVVETPDEQVSEVTEILHRESGLLVHSMEDISAG